MAAPGLPYALVRLRFLRGPLSMTELKVSLEFACPACRQPIGVTVQCAGAQLSVTSKIIANVAVPCPTCGQVHMLTFEPDGTIHAVTPHPPRRLPEPSRN